MSREIKSVAVLGAGTMGTGIAGLAAEQDCKVLLLDASMEAAEKALERIVNGRPPAIDTPGKEANITLGTLEDDLEKDRRLRLGVRGGDRRPGRPSAHCSTALSRCAKTARWRQHEHVWDSASATSPPACLTAY